MDSSYRSRKSRKYEHGRKRDRDERKGTYKGSATTQQAKRTGGWAQPTLGGELKFIDNSATGTLGLAASTFATPVLLNGCVPDATATGRIGRKIVMKSLYFRYTATLQATSTLGGNVRIILVYDKQANAAAPAITDVLLADDFRSPNNLSNRDRFTVLADEITDVISANGNYACSGVIYKKLNMETMFNAGTAGTIADITTGSLYLLVGQSGQIATAAPQLVWRSRVRFHDM